MSIMDIHSRKGTKVVFCNPDSGYEYDQELAKEYLTVGKTYTVNHTEVYDWYTRVCLEEVPGITFNSVLFDDKED